MPGDPIAFVTQLSEKLAEYAPQLTLDFIHEVSAAITTMDKTAITHRISCLSYMSPWIQNLSCFASATHPLYERSGARLRDCIRTLADLSLAYPEVRANTYIFSHCLTSLSDYSNYTKRNLVRGSEAGRAYSWHCFGRARADGHWRRYWNQKMRNNISHHFCTLFN